MPLLEPMPIHQDIPRYEWECGSCPVGFELECEFYIWDEDGKEKVVENVAVEEGDKNGAQ